MSNFLQYIQNLQRFGIRPGLERIEALLARAGNPHRNYPHILIGGTNGKGSTCEFTARLLAQNSKKIGLYTSPHLYAWNERIRILPGEGLFEGAISDADLDALFSDARPHIEAVAKDLGQPTEFEVVTFLGLWHFARQKVDAAVLEVGLGGKWDATNATDPLVSCVTHVALDHMDRLGNTLEEIAADKVCIARKNRSFYTAERKPEVLAVFEKHCAEVESWLNHVNGGHDEFQKSNVFLAHCVARDFSLKVGWPAPKMREFKLRVPGRLETIAQNPRILIDGANNPDGARHLADEIKKRRVVGKPRVHRENLILVLGILADKNWREMTQILAPLAKTVICTQSNSPRAVEAAKIALVAREFCSDVEIIEPVVKAVDRAKFLALESDTILVTGSFTTIAEVPRTEL